MKQLLAVLFGVLTVSSAFATETFNGTIVKSNGKLYRAIGTPCQIQIFDQSADHVGVAMTVGSDSSNIYQLNRSSLQGLEKLLYSFGQKSEFEPIAGTRDQKQSFQFLRLTDSGKKVMMVNGLYIKEQVTGQTHQLKCEAILQN